MGILRLLIPEILATQAGVADTGSEASASLAAENLLTDELWQAWRSGINIPGNTAGYGGINGDPLLNLDAVAMAGLNMVPGNGEVMAVLMNNTLPYSAFQAMVPTAIAASTGITGAYTDVDEGFGATDGSYIVPTTSNSSVTFDFGTPTNTPRTGAMRQAFWVRVFASADTEGANAWKRPTVRVDLYENVSGSPHFIRTLGTKAVFGTVPHWLFFSWDASLLATANGSNVQARVIFGQETVSGTQARLDSIVWACESTHISGAGGYVADSGWVKILADPISGSGWEIQPARADWNSRWSYKFDQAYSASRVYFYLREDHVSPETLTSTVRVVLCTPPGYVEAGKLAAGIWWSPAINRAEGQFVTVDDPSPKNDDEGGGEWGSREDARDSFKIKLDWLTEQEAAWLNRRLLHEYGTLTPFYIELEPDATQELGFGGWVTLLSASNPISRRNTDTYLYSMEFTVRIKR